MICRATFIIICCLLFYMNGNFFSNFCERMVINMPLFAIGDLHLSFGVNKPMDIFKGWENYTEKLYENWQSVVKADDTVVICGDISWAMNLEELYSDFAFIEKLNGRKIIIKGNHDLWWQTLKKLNDFIATSGFKTIEFLHNSCAVADGKAICGTRGWIFEGKTESKDDLKVINRECMRLEASLKEGEKTGLPITAFLHYPPVFDIYECERIIELLNIYNVKSCYYGHIHGASSRYAVFGEYKNVEFKLISADYINFMPLKL